MLLGQYEKAESTFLAAVELVENMGSRLSLPSLWQKIGDCRLVLGRPDEAEKAFFNSIEIGREKSQEPFYMGAYRGLAALELERGNLASANDHCGKFMELARKYNDQSYILDGRILEARIAFAGSPDTSLADLASMLDQPLPPLHRADVLYWIWKLKNGPDDKRAALEALEEISVQAPSAKNITRIKELHQ